ncbi:hypothetical protein LTR28_001975, partial [Elasticomyces elasticus]
KIRRQVHVRWGDYRHSHEAPKDYRCVRQHGPRAAEGEGDWDDEIRTRQGCEGRQRRRSL